MIGFDTNILVRHFAKDDLAQAAAVRKAFLKAVELGEPVFVSQIVLCELVWVLAVTYRHEKQAIIAALEELLRAGHVEIEGSEAVLRALNDYRSGHGGFADYLIAERAVAAGCKRILTFDSDLWVDPRFVAPGRWAR